MFARAGRRHQTMAEIGIAPQDRDRLFLLAVGDRNENSSAGAGQLDPGSEKPLAQSGRERLVDAEHFAGGFHLGTKDRLYATHFRKRKDRDLHDDERRAWSQAAAVLHVAQLLSER